MYKKCTSTYVISKFRWTLILLKTNLKGIGHGLMNPVTCKLQWLTIGLITGGKQRRTGRHKMGAICHVCAYLRHTFAQFVVVCNATFWLLLLWNHRHHFIIIFIFDRINMCYYYFTNDPYSPFLLFYFLVKTKINFIDSRTRRSWKW